MVQVELLKGYRRRSVGTKMEVSEGLADGLAAIGLAKRADVAPEPATTENVPQPETVEEIPHADHLEDASVAEFNRLHPDAPEVEQ